MFNTSDGYKEAILSGLLDSDITGEIKLSDGSVIPVSEKDIVPGSLKIDNKAVNGSDLVFGGIYVGQLSVTLLADIDRYSLYGAEVRFVYHLNIRGADPEDIPLGVFYVYEASRTRKMIQLKAYDIMTNLDADITENTNGSTLDIIHFACEVCGIELGTTDEEIGEWVNSEWGIGINIEQIRTWRQVISQIATINGLFATIDRYGKLVFRPIMSYPVNGIPPRLRTESTIQDYETFFSGVKCRFFAQQNYYPYTAIDDTVEKGLMMDLGDINVIQGDEDTKNEILSRVLGIVTANIYVPCKFSMISDPSIDLGDGIVLTNVNGTEDYIFSQVHAISWTYHGKTSISCYGADPFFDGIVSEDEKIYSKVESQLSSKDLVIRTFTNSGDVSVSGSFEQAVVNIGFAAVSDTTVLFMATIPIETDADGVIVFRYYYDMVLDESSTVRQYVSRGSHITTLTNNITMRENSRISLVVTAQSEAFESDSRRQSAKILSLLDYVQNQSITVDGNGVPTLSTVYTEQSPIVTPPGGIIRSQSVKAAIFAQGLAGAGVWDGTISIEQPVPVFGIGQLMALSPFSEEFGHGRQTPKSSTISHTVPVFGIGLGMTFGSFTESVASRYVVLNETIDAQKLSAIGYDRRYVTEQDGAVRLITTYEYDSTEHDIDIGVMSGVKVETSDKASTTGIEVNIGG